jgi:phosphate uptake regulator
VEIRKIQLTGGSSLSVTLPKTWAEKTQISAGDVVGCQENPDGSLTVFAHARGARTPQEHRLEHDGGSSEFLFRRIIAAYLMGYDTIQVKSKGPLTTSTREVVRRAVRRIMGLEVVDEDAQSVTLQDFLDPREFHIEKALRRMAILTQAMQEEAFGNLQAPKKDATASAEDRDDEVDRLFWLINKQYHALLRDASYAAKMETTATQALNYLLAARLLERTADHADRVVTESLQIPKGKRDPSLMERLQADGRAASALFARAVTTLLKPDAKGANQVLADSTKLQTQHEDLLKHAIKLGPEAISHLALIIESIQRTTAYAADIAEIAINHEVATGASARSAENRPRK